MKHVFRIVVPQGWATVADPKWLAEQSWTHERQPASRIAVRTAAHVSVG